MPKPRGNVTYKEKQFIREYIKSNGNGMQSALRSYNVKNSKVAGALASENLSKPRIQEELNRQLQRRGLSLENLSSKLSEIAGSNPLKGYSGSDILNAVTTGLKLHGVLSDKKQVTTYNLNYDLSSMSKQELLELRNKKQKETDIILQDEQ